MSSTVTCPLCNASVSITALMEKRSCGHWLLLAGEVVIALNSTDDDAPTRAAQRLGEFFYNDLTSTPQPAVSLPLSTTKCPTKPNGSSTAPRRWLKKMAKKPVLMRISTLSGQTLQLFGNGLSRFQVICNAASARHALGLSQSEMARVLSAYMAGPVTGKGVATFEFAARARSRKARQKYAPSMNVVTAYCRAVEDTVKALSNGGIRVRCRVFSRTHWRFSLVRHCRNCGREFTLRQVREVRCSRCRAKG